MAQLQFKGKQFVQNLHLVVKYHELIPQKEKSLTDKISLHDNLIIHGDNLKALKALLPTYAGKVKCIYIDPPYNTGNEKWVYNDNVNSPMIQEWFGKIVDIEDLTRHDKWLCMMTPRLKLLKEMLCENGIIFVSIDDNELYHLKMLLDEIFQEENFICNFIWQKNSGGGNDSTHVATSHEYILCYAKNINDSNFRIYNLPPTEGMLNTYVLEDKYINTRGKHALRNLNDFSIGDRPGLHYDIVCPDNTVLEGDARRWRCDESTFLKRVDEDRIVFEKNDDGEWEIFYKVYINEQKGKIEIDKDGEILSLGKKPNSLLYKLAFTGQGKKDLEKIFKISPFNYPKPVDLIKHLISMASKKDGDIILDSFAGSGTTAQAVSELNKDEKNRKVILIQIPEKIKQKVYINKETSLEESRPKRGITSTEFIEKPFLLADGTKLEEIIDVIEYRLKHLPNKISFSYFYLGKPIEIESILSGKNLPTYLELARYVFYTATGEEFNEKAIDEKRNFIGENGEYEIYLFYKPNLEYLKNTALTLDRAKNLGSFKTKKRLVFAPTKYLDQDQLDQYRIDFAQLPFEIYKLAK